MAGKILPIEGLDMREQLWRPETAAVEEVEAIPISLGGKRFVNLRSSLKDLQRKDIFVFLNNNVNVFAWLATNMPEIDPNVITHKLKVDLEV